jgi:hypothetical protein
VLGGAIEDCLQIVRRGAKSLFHFGGDVSLRGDFAAVGGCYLDFDAAVMNGCAFITIEIAVCGFGNLIENASDAFSGRGLNIRGGRTAANFLIEAQLIALQFADGLFKHHSCTRAELRAIQVAAISEIPRCIRSHSELPTRHEPARGFSSIHLTRNGGNEQFMGITGSGSVSGWGCVNQALARPSSRQFEAPIRRSSLTMPLNSAIAFGSCGSGQLTNGSNS